MPALKPSPSNVDPNVRIPAAVKAGIAKAEAHFKAAEAPPADPPEPPDAPAAAAAAAPPVPVEPAAPAAPVVTEPPTPGGNADWEARYNAMKGRHDKLAPQIREMSEQISSLQRVIADMKATPAAAQTPSAARLVTPDEETAFGAEFLDVVGRRAQERFDPEIASLKQEMAGIKDQLGKVGGSVALNARERMVSALNEQVTNWQEINLDQKFLQWLALPDTYSGAIRQELLLAAWERNDTPRTIAFFNGFLSEEAAVAPQPRVPDVPAGGDAPPNGKVPLDTFAAPGRARSAAGKELPTEKPTFTRAQIAQFYTDSASGKYRGREAEYKKLEAQIFDAERNGRIR